MTEIAQVRADAGSVIPNGAVLEYACQISTLEQVTPTSLKESIQKNFHFRWPTHRVEALLFYKRGNCHKADAGAFQCRQYGSMVQIGEGDPFEYASDIGDDELQELIAYLQGMLPSDGEITEIVLLDPVVPDGHDPGKRKYGVEIRGGKEVARIVIERQCSETGNCTLVQSPHTWFRRA